MKICQISLVTGTSVRIFEANLHTLDHHTITLMVISQQVDTVKDTYVKSKYVTSFSTNSQSLHVIIGKSHFAKTVTKIIFFSETELTQFHGSITNTKHIPMY